MPRLFFHHQTTDELIRDQDGDDIQTIAEARMVALESARELMSQNVRRGKAPDGDSYVITDEAGATVLVVLFKDAITSD